MKRPLSLLLACSLTSLSQAQLGFTYGPQDAPLGCPIHLTINNDNDHSIQWDPCGFRIVDAANNVIYVPPCSGPVVLMPGDTFDHVWPQVDNAGAQVAPGTYFLDDVSGIAIQVGTAQTAIAPLGASRVGTTRGFQLCSPQDPGARYMLLASADSSPGIATCGGLIPLRRDRIFGLSRRTSGAFLNFSGFLDANGCTSLPALAIPANPSLAGLRLQLAFIVVDPNAACPVRRISAPYVVTIG